RPSQNRSKRPQRPAMAVFRSLGLVPGAPITQEISEAAVYRIKGMSQESQIPRSQAGNCQWLGLFELIEENGENQRPRVVVGGVSLGVVGHRKGGVLQHSGIVSQAMQVIEFQRGELVEA